MSATASSLEIPDPRRRTFRLPHWGWCLLVTVVLIAGYVSVLIWLPWHRQQMVIREIERLGGDCATWTGGPEWLRQLLGDDRMENFKIFDRVETVILIGTRLTDEE